MKPLRNTEREIVNFSTRIVFAAVIVALAFAILVTRFAWLQVFRHDDLHARAEQNRIALVPNTANRGLIKDRNGVVIARNYSAYTLEISPREVANLAATIDELAGVVDIQPRDRRRFKKLLDESRQVDSVPIRTRLTDDEVARFAANKWRFPGVELQARLFRHYPLGEVGAHLIGYIGRISQKDAERVEKFMESADYNGTEYIGKTGVELSYEAELHGITGYEEVEITAGGRAVRSLKRRASTPGNNLLLSVDIELQKVAEKAFGDRRGALIAIEPSTGEILAFVSKPTFDPNLFVDGIDPINWDQLNTSPDKPLLNRALRGTYPIGSTYKPFLALAALETGKRRAETVINDPGYFMYAGHRFRDSGPPGGHGAVNLHRSIVVSSDVYYYMLANDMGVDRIHDFMKPFGFGQLTGIDIEGEMTGVLPSTTWKEKRYKQKWFGGETISIGIGQGYNAFTMLQLAHATAIMANDGVVLKPHLVRAVEDVVSGTQKPVVPSESLRIPLNPAHLALVREAMVDVNISGTGRAAFQGVPYKVAGKTGTAQVVGIKQNEKYDEKRMEERHRDHSLFIAFAPAEVAAKPKIALAVLVENGGFGARAAAPIARQVLDYVLLGKVPAAPAGVQEGDEAAAAGDRPVDLEPLTGADAGHAVGADALATLPAGAAGAAFGRASGSTSSSSSGSSSSSTSGAPSSTPGKVPGSPPALLTPTPSSTTRSVLPAAAAGRPEAGR